MNLDHHPGIQVRNGEISEITELQLLMQRVLPLYVSPAGPVYDLHTSGAYPWCRDTRIPNNVRKQKLFPVAEKMKLYKTAGTGKFVR